MTPSALRFYEEVGLLVAEGRTESGYRVYGRGAANRLRFIRDAKALGLRLSEIRTLIDSRRGAREEERAFFGGFLQEKIEETNARIAELKILARKLRALESNLDSLPPRECGHLGDCACWLGTPGPSTEPLS